MGYLFRGVLDVHPFWKGEGVRGGDGMNRINRFDLAGKFESGEL